MIGTHWFGVSVNYVQSEQVADGYLTISKCKVFFSQDSCALSLQNSPIWHLIIYLPLWDFRFSCPQLWRQVLWDMVLCSQSCRWAYWCHHLGNHTTQPEMRLLLSDYMVPNPRRLSFSLSLWFATFSSKACFENGHIGVWRHSSTEMAEDYVHWLNMVINHNVT